MQSGTSTNIASEYEAMKLSHKYLDIGADVIYGGNWSYKWIRALRDEYVPIKTPTSKANEKSCIISPPIKNRAITTSKVVPEVINVLLRVSVILKLIVSSSGFFLYLP